ncbi:aldehyde dehydrogenase family protein [Haloarcula sp. GH36]|uniref:aldehyde dehydrogenase family protein n=1 Tax=Haloarcula montana TaxID=3111776 RepID=UPI002D77FF9C|nr:aldehyde dehydrogenase family protein [Haloarcula sp. GH36]
MAELTVPVVSGGERTTRRTRTLTGVGGDLAAVAQAPRVRVHDAVETARESGFDDLRAIPVRELLDRLADAGRRFAGHGPTGDLAPVGEYAARVARASGLPVGWVRTSVHWLAHGLRHAAESLRAQSPTGDLAVYDDPSYVRERDVGLAFAPRIRVLGGVMPANDPAVYAWPALAVGMKIPIVLRPSRRDPFTAVRLARALLAAGVPETAVHVLPGDRSVGETVATRSDHALVFGSQAVTDRYHDDPAVETYGPGQSVAVLARRPTDRELDSLARGIVRAGGRTCFNLTRIVAVEACDADELAAALAERVVGATDGPVTDPATDVPSFTDGDRAGRVDDLAEDAGRDVTAPLRNGPRLRDYGDHARLAPTVVRSDEFVEELPFQFAGVTDRSPSSPADLLASLDSAYLGVAVGDDYEAAMARSPHVRKVYGGGYPSSVDLRETHETFLAAFCYETTTYDPS